MFRKGSGLWKSNIYSMLQYNARYYLRPTTSSFPCDNCICIALLVLSCSILVESNFAIMSNTALSEML